MTEKELLQLKENVEKAQKLLSELVGQKNYILKDLKTNWDCDPEDIDELILQYTRTLDDLQQEQDAIIQKIKDLQNG